MWQAQGIDPLNNHVSNGYITMHDRDPGFEKGDLCRLLKSRVDCAESACR